MPSSEISLAMLMLRCCQKHDCGLFAFAAALVLWAKSRTLPVSLGRDENTSQKLEGTCLLAQMIDCTLQAVGLCIKVQICMVINVSGSCCILTSVSCLCV